MMVMGAQMRKGLLVFTLGALAFAGAAQAQVTNVQGSAGSTVAFLGGPNSRGPGAGVVTDSAGSGAAYDATVLIGPATVSFDSGDAASGPFVRATSTTSVDITFINNSNEFILPQFHSTIIPQGLGFYLADQTGGCGGNVFTGCPQTLSSWALSDLRASSPSSATDPLGQVAFDFRVLDAGQILYRLSGGMDLLFDTTSGQTQVVQNLASAAAALTNFRQTTPAGSASALGFGWDATDILLTSTNLLAPGQSRTFTYLVSVSGSSTAACLDAVTCMVAYAGFGDPIAQGGGVTNAAPLSFSLASLSSSIAGVQFQPFVFGAPTYSNGVVTFTGVGSRGVPEPATWALMLAGVGLAGAALRRRRRLAMA